MVSYEETFTTTQPFYHGLMEEMGGLEGCHPRVQEFLCLVLMPGCEPTVRCCVKRCGAKYWTLL